MRRTRIYVSGPLTTGMLTRNVRAALDAAAALLSRGYAVYVPHTNILWEIVHPASYETWIQHDFEWVDVCDAVLRVEGASHGGDREVERAFNVYKGPGVQPVYRDVETLCQYEPVLREEYSIR